MFRCIVIYFYFLFYFDQYTYFLFVSFVVQVRSQRRPAEANLILHLAVVFDCIHLVPRSVFPRFVFVLFVHCGVTILFKLSCKVSQTELRLHFYTSSAFTYRATDIVILYLIEIKHFQLNNYLYICWSQMLAMWFRDVVSFLRQRVKNSSKAQWPTNPKLIHVAPT